MKFIRIIILFVVLSLFFPNSLRAQSSGGAFEIRQSIVASGGASNLAGGPFTIGATAGQTSSGNSGAGNFSLRGGFWEFQSLAPTAANVTIGGRIVTAGGAGVRNVMVTLTDTRGTIRTTVTGTFGMYRFTDVAVGETYVLTVMLKKYVFANPSQIVSVGEELTNLDFVADEQ